MKNIVITAILILASNGINAQFPIYPLDTSPYFIEDEAYLKDTDNELNKYEGTWAFSQNGINMTIKLDKILWYKDIPKYYKDVVNGNYKLIENGVVIYDDLSDSVSDVSNIIGSTLSNDDQYYILTFWDRQNCDITGTIRIKIDANNPDILHWQMYNDEQGVIFLSDCPQAADPDFDLSLPKNMILHRVD